MPTVIEWGVTGRTFAVIIVGKRQFPNPCRSIQFYQNKKTKTLLALLNKLDVNFG